jgi:hypothetical protein
MNDREALAKANVERVVREMAAAWTVEVHRLLDGYTLRLASGERTFVRSSIDEAVLEDDWSSVRDGLIEQARQQLDAR